MVISTVGIKPFEGLHLTFVEKTAIQVPGQKRDTCICLRFLGAEVGWQFLKPFNRDHIALSYATGDLLEKSQGHVAELVFKPFVRGVIEILVPPKGRKARPIGKAHLLADGVIALVVRQVDKEVGSSWPSAWEPLIPIGD